MKLDRNIEGNGGRGKYALLRLRKLNDLEKPNGVPTEIHLALGVLMRAGLVDWGDAGTEGEFFVIRLKDKYAQSALMAYASSAAADDKEYADEIFNMAGRSGTASPFCKRPD
jgi:hypothetical protein